MKKIGKIIVLFLSIPFINAQVDYETQIQTIFNNSCTSCHIYGHNSGLNLTTYSATMIGGTSGAAVVAGDHANSLLWTRVNNGSMPPNGNLEPDLVDLIAQWIDEGALQVPQDADVTINLNMSTAGAVTDSTHNLVIRGSFNGWAGNDMSLNSQGGDYYSYTGALDTGSYEFKFVAVDLTTGTDIWESTDNRILNVSANDTTITCYWENGDQPPYTATDSIDIWFRVNTAGIPGYDPATTPMKVAGSFEGWSGTELTREGDTDFWSGHFTRDPATTHTLIYKFKAGETWENDPNRLLTVSSDTTVAWKYFNDIAPTPSELVSVTFRANMSTTAVTDSTHDVQIRGSFNGWQNCTECSAINVGGDYWEFTVELWTGTYDFKICPVDDLGNEAWESTPNRVLTIGLEDMETELLFYNHGTTPPYTPTDSIDVWFRVNTFNIPGYDPAVSPMRVAGSFNGWGDAPVNLAQEGNSEFWSGHFTFAPGEAHNVEYKFRAGDDWESIDNRGTTLSSDTTLSWKWYNDYPPGGGGFLTKTVLFQVDMTEWLNEEGLNGMPVFSVANGDGMFLRGDFNGWADDTTLYPPESPGIELVRTPGTNLLSAAVAMTNTPSQRIEYKYFMKLSDASVTTLESVYGQLFDYLGYEDSPVYGGGNRFFSLNDQPGEVLTRPLEGYYDLPAGGVIPAGQTVGVTYSVDMTGAAADGFDAATDSVFVAPKDRWSNLFNGFGEGPLFYATDENGDGVYSVTVSLNGPNPWHSIYAWAFKNNDLGHVEEGGGFGNGRSRARYMHQDADNNCAWADYTFPTDTWQKEPPLPGELFDPSSICGAPNELVNSGFEGGFDGWEAYPGFDSQALVYTGETMFGSDNIFNAFEGVTSVKLWGLYNGSENAENNLFQTFEGDNALAPGSQLSVTAHAMSHESDFIGQGNSDVAIFAKYFGDGWAWIGMDSTHINGSSFTENDWHHIGIEGTIPEEATIVQVGIMHIQPTNDDHGSIYVDMLKMHRGWTLATDDDGTTLQPKKFSLGNNYPNPFNPSTTIDFSVPVQSGVTFTIYNVLGEEMYRMSDDNLTSGVYRVRWNGKNKYGVQVPSGIYFYQLEAGESFRQTKKMTLIK